MSANETQHYAEGDAWTARAEERFCHGEFDQAVACAAIAQAHYAGSQAADHDRLAGCVPDGVDALAVSVRGR